MALRRVFADSIEDGLARVEGDRARHLYKVARLAPGEAVEVSDGVQAYAAVVERASARRVDFRLGAQLAAPPPRVGVELHLAVIKFPRWEWALEKATELGVEAIAPIAAERSDRGLLSAAEKRVERWRKIAEEAAQQARRLASPEVTQPLSLAAALRRPADLRLLLDFDAPLLREHTARTALSPPARVALLVGPEGGWSEAERQAALEAGCLPAAFGRAVLRSETAAVAAAAALGHLLER